LVDGDDWWRDLHRDGRRQLSHDYLGLSLVDGHFWLRLSDRYLGSGLFHRDSWIGLCHDDPTGVALPWLSGLASLSRLSRPFADGRLAGLRLTFCWCLASLLKLRR
jgi:hypothetical protein